MRKGTCLGMVAVVALLLAGWLSGCSRAPAPQTQADRAVVGTFIADVSGSVDPGRVAEVVAALDRLAAEASRTVIERWAEKLWPLVEQWGPMLVGRVLG